MTPRPNPESRSRFVRAALIGLALLAARPASAEDAALARVTSAAGTFAARFPTDLEYRVLPAGAGARAGETLVALPGATLEAADRSVALRCLADYGDGADLPALESAVSLHEPRGVDFDVALDRGRIELIDTKPSGRAAVRVRFAGESWRVAFDAPGTRVAVEVAGRWAPGTRFVPATAAATARPAGPALYLSLWVLSGAADVSVGGATVALSARPNPMRVAWSSTGGPQRPEVATAVPAWAESGPKDEEGRRIRAAVEKFRKARLAGPREALDAFLASVDPDERRVGLVSAGAVDDLARLVDAVGNARTAEQSDFAVMVLRHWLGRSDGQDQRLFQFLQADGAYGPAQARIAVQLLIGFKPDDLKRPEAYEVLVDYLLHGKAAIRNLAAWHLARQVPKERAVAFRPTATPAECARYHADWKKAVEAGTGPRK